MANADIVNDNEFYSEHYLADIFEGDIRGVPEAWQQRATEHGDKTPWALLHRDAHKRLREIEAVHALARRGRAREAVDAVRNLARPLLEAFGYAAHPERLSRECLRYMYWLLFLFYIWAGKISNICRKASSADLPRRHPPRRPLGKDRGIPRPLHPPGPGEGLRGSLGVF
ncbi:hypothetical protein [Billgrantia endophytica]|uniref:Uncharacterized protein n=1 Tax=Billgrantia endophytica TaxID=2033802 RepID=A0A2N7TVA3_9GAMM|nr:hypothetical protein [Halomonas endophytica]PMR72078.1 hypothetical protein C1H69_22100 [Halomonas endophytica]